MKQLRIMAVVAAAMLLAACSRTPRIDIAAEETSVRALSAHWLELENAHDAMGAAALFTENGVRFRAHHEPAAGMVAIEAAATKDFSDNPKMVMDWTADTVIVSAAADLAVELGTYSMTHAGLSGEAADRGHFVTVYRKVNGQWKVASGMGATVNPEPRPVVAAPRVVLASTRSKPASARSARPVAKTVARKSTARKSTAKTPSKVIAKAPAKKGTRSATRSASKSATK